MLRYLQLFVLCGVFYGIQAQIPVNNIRDIIGKVNIDTLSKHVRYLSGEDSVMTGGIKHLIRVRKPGTLTHIYAGDYIKSRLFGYGFPVYEQNFTTTVSGRNIYAVQAGKDTGSIYILCAHYDAVTDYAADDNATGVAAVLEAARIFSTYPLEHTLMYCFWDQEETGLHGSRSFARWLWENGKQVGGVINLDMLGWDGNSDGYAEIHTRNYANSVSMADNLFHVNTSYSISLNPAIYNPGTTSSDHYSFWVYNYSAILLIEAYRGGDFNPYYHSVLDRFSNLSLPYFHRMTKLALAGMASYVINNQSRQTIDLKHGWNLISAAVLPDSLDMKSVFRTLINNGALVKIQDESGRSLENLGTIGGWTNNIGNLSLTEGYKIKVAGDCLLTIDGVYPGRTPAIPLNTGWNIIGFPHGSPEDGLEVVRPLIDNGNLVKIQDEKGNSIEDWGIFGGWINNIGNFSPGEGYKVRVHAPDTLSIPELFIKSGNVSKTAISDPLHFRPVSSGNGIDHMNINLVDLPGSLLLAGDEIGVFDGDQCVGSVTMLPSHLNYKRVSIPVSACDDSGCPGFTENNRFSLKLWKTLHGKEYPLEFEIIRGTPFFRKNETAFINIGKNISLRSDIFQSDKWGLKIYPNPTTGKVSIRMNSWPGKEATIELLNSSGQKMMEKILYENHVTLDMSRYPAGIYYVKITGGTDVKIEKLILQ